MVMQTEKNGGGVFGSLLLFLSGVGVGMLIATKPGKETREQIADMLRSTRSKGRDFLRRGREQVSETVEEGKEKIEQGKEGFYESGKYT